jgi:aminopeptidase-like protein
MTPLLDLIQETWFTRRDIVSDGFDQVLRRLAQEVPMTLHEYPSGESCWTWFVPEKWTCDEAYLAPLDPRSPRLVDYADHPLHVVSYSLPFEGVVSRQELLRHLHVHPRLPQAIPFVFKYYDRDWGLCLPQIQRDALQDDAYRVVIRTRFEPGTLKVGEVVIPGESRQTIVLAAHLCHPAMVNDDLSGVVVGLEAARALRSGRMPGDALPVQAFGTRIGAGQPGRLYYTYRLLILPETIGSVAYLSHHEDLIPHLVGGLFLEMLGSDAPHALQGSFYPASQADQCFTSTLPVLDPLGYCAPYRTVINNDERQFNAPGVRVPMLSLSRVERRDSPTWPYPEYHSSLDTPEIVSEERLQASLRTTLGLIQAWERNLYPVNRFKGEIFCSGQGIWIDYRANPEGHRRLFDIMERCDGEHSVADIACELGVSFPAVWEVVSLLHAKDLVGLSRTPQTTDPHRITANP